MRKHRFEILICVLLLLTGCAAEQEVHEIELQERESCLLCSAETAHEIQNYLGQDNIGIIDLNTFDVLPIQINYYDESGELIQDVQDGCGFGLAWHGRKFCVSDIRQREGSHAINVDRKGITPCLLQSPEDVAVCALSTA